MYKLVRHGHHGAMAPWHWLYISDGSSVPHFRQINPLTSESPKELRRFRVCSDRLQILSRSCESLLIQFIRVDPAQIH